MVIFFWSIFGYMAFLIFFKWIAPMDNPPLILPIMINMFLSPQSDLSKFDVAYRRLLCLLQRADVSRCQQNKSPE